MDAEDPKSVLANNLVPLMEREFGKSNIWQLARQAGIGPASAKRLVDGKTSVGIDLVACVAKLFKVSTWQMLYPNLDPYALPECHQLSPDALHIAQLVDGLKVSPAERDRLLSICRLTLQGAPPAANNHRPLAPPAPDPAPTPSPRSRSRR